MGLKDDIVRRIDTYTQGDYDIKKTRKIPTAQDLGFRRHGRIIETAILYADLRGSSEVTERHRRHTTARIFKSFLYAMARIARSHEGAIRSYDGDRIMVVFPPDPSGGNAACSVAAQTGLEMAWFFKEVLIPKLRRYDNALDFGVGIAFSPMLAVRVGLGRNPDNNDIIFIGRAANLAAKLSDKAKSPNYIWIDQEIHRRLGDEWKYVDPQASRRGRRPIWTSRKLNFAGGKRDAYATRHTHELN